MHLRYVHNAIQIVSKINVFMEVTYILIFKSYLFESFFQN